MTYGEYHYLIKYDMRLKDGKWVTNKPNTSIPKKMPREIAREYYKNKFKDYWISLKKAPSTANV